MDILRKTHFISLVLVFITSNYFASFTFAQDNEPHALLGDMATIVWSDLQWSKNKANVNDILKVTGKFQLFREGSKTTSGKALVFLELDIPRDAFVFIMLKIGGQLVHGPASLTIGKTYDFTMLSKARSPGDWNVQTRMYIDSIGPINGPGTSVTITGGKFSEFKPPLTTLTGDTIDLENYSESNTAFWYVFWGVIGVVLVVYWIRPMFQPGVLTYRRQNEKTIFNNVSFFSEIIFVVVVFVFLTWWISTRLSNYPTTPLQANNMPTIKPLETASDRINKPEWPRVLYNPPRYVGYGSFPKVLASFDFTKEPDELKHKSNTHEKQKYDVIRTPKNATAKLTGMDFTIISLTGEDKPVKNADNTKWEWMWTIHPKQLGEKPLDLTINSDFLEGGHKQTIILQRTLDIRMSSINDYYSWFKDNYQMTLAIISMLGMTVAFFVHHINKKPV